MSARRFHTEQDARYVPEQCPVTKIWMATKRELLKTWTIYEFVGSPSYQTPLEQGLTESQAKRLLQELEAQP